MQARVDAAADEEARKAEEEAARKAEDEDRTSGADEKEKAGGKTDAAAPRRRVGNVEVLKPGALYRECAVVQLDVPAPSPPPVEKETKPKNKKGKARTDEVPLEDDGEFGGEVVGRAVWEWYESRLKIWEERDKERVKAEEEQAAKEKAEAEAKDKEDNVPSEPGAAPAGPETPSAQNS